MYIVTPSRAPRRWRSAPRGGAAAAARPAGHWPQLVAHPAAEQATTAAASSPSVLSEPQPQSGALLEPDQQHHQPRGRSERADAGRVDRRRATSRRGRGRRGRRTRAPARRRSPPNQNAAEFDTVLRDQPGDRVAEPDAGRRRRPTAARSRGPPPRRGQVVARGRPSSAASARARGPAARGRRRVRAATSASAASTPPSVTAARQ